MFGKWLSSPKTKAELMDELRAGAKSTVNEFDDAAVDAFEGVWDYAVACILKKL